MAAILHPRAYKYTPKQRTSKQTHYLLATSCMHTLVSSPTMALRTFLFAMVLLAGVCAPVAQAQLGRILISGIVPCSNSTKTTTQTTPAFPNALVQLLCGGSVVSSATTNGDGVFTILLNPLTMLLSTLLSSCNLVVDTPLSTCDSSLPSTGILQSALQLLNGGLLGSVLGGLFNNIIPVGFNLVH